jgi:hypothetical protein
MQPENTFGGGERNSAIPQHKQLKTLNEEVLCGARQIRGKLESRPDYGSDTLFY